MGEASENLILDSKLRVLGQITNELKPVMNINIERTEYDPKNRYCLWTQPPHPHEKYLLQAYVRFIEGQPKNEKSTDSTKAKNSKTQGGWLTIEEHVDYISLLNHVNGYMPNQVTQDQPLERQIRPVLLDQNQREIRNQQIDILSDAELSPDKPDNFQQILLRVARQNVLCLLNSGLLNIHNISELDELILHYK